MSSRNEIETDHRRLQLPDGMSFAPGDRIESTGQPVFREMGITDPHALDVDGRLYFYCGHDYSWHSETDWDMRDYRIFSTRDLRAWRYEAGVDTGATYTGPHRRHWGSDIATRNGDFFWYFSGGPESTGVLRAPTPVGPFRDGRGSPLVDMSMVENTKPYDVDIFEENGEHFLIVGCPRYYIARLNPDMISLAEKLRPIEIRGVNAAADKACVFKRDGLYYLSWGMPGYAVSRNLYGPYEFQGPFIPEAGHANVFHWRGRRMMAYECRDISLFYRGFAIDYLEFDADGRPYLEPRIAGSLNRPPLLHEFERSTMGWRPISGTSVEWAGPGILRGTIDGAATIESCPWPAPDIFRMKRFTLRLAHDTIATRARVHIAIVPHKPVFWTDSVVRWDEAFAAEIELGPGDGVARDYAFDLPPVPADGVHIQRIRIEPALDVRQGAWRIERIEIEKEHQA